MPMSLRDQVESQAAELAENCLAVRVRLLSRLVSGIYEKQIRNSSLTIGQLNMLAATISIGPQNASASTLSKALCMEKSTVSRNLDKLEAQGWVRRHTPTQGRTETLSVTPSGRRVFAKSYPGWQEAQQQVETELGDDLYNSIIQGIPMGTAHTH